MFIYLFIDLKQCDIFIYFRTLLRIKKKIRSLNPRVGISLQERRPYLLSSLSSTNRNCKKSKTKT